MSEEIDRRLNEWVSREYEWLRKQIGKNISNGKMKDYTLDLLHHIILDLYKMNPDKIEGMLDNDKLKWYVLRGAALQLKSSTSPFYRTHRKQKMSARSGMIDTGVYDNLSTYEINSQIDDEEELMDCFERAMDSIHWYQRTLLEKKIIEGNSYQEIYEYYNISKTHLIKDINAGLSEIREICKNAKNG